MMDLWSLPKSVTFGDEEYEINTDFRDILEIMDFFQDDASPTMVRWEIALELFYNKPIPMQYKKQAMEYLSEFISYGSDESDDNNKRKVIDWKLDSSVIIGDINKVAGFEIRSAPYIHWWTFLSYFNGIGEGQLSTIVSIRTKLAKGKKLEKWEQDYYNEHKRQIDMRTAEDKKEVREYFNKWL